MLKHTVKITGVEKLIKELKNNSVIGGDIVYHYYPYLTGSFNSAGADMTIITKYLIKHTGFDFIERSMKLCLSQAGDNNNKITTKMFREAMWNVLTENGQKPALSERALRMRVNYGAEGSPRNIITGKYIELFRIAKVKAKPMDIYEPWIVSVGSNK